MSTITTIDSSQRIQKIKEITEDILQESSIKTLKDSKNPFVHSKMISKSRAKKCAQGLHLYNSIVNRVYDEDRNPIKTVKRQCCYCGRSPQNKSNTI